MSTYSKITRHPQTGEYEKARWIDDYYGPHLYGVEFASDDKVYPEDMVAKAQLKEFWAADVIGAFKKVQAKAGSKTVIAFLEALNEEYKERWDRDPEGGEGAGDHYKSKYNKG